MFKLYKSKGAGLIIIAQYKNGRLCGFPLNDPYKRRYEFSYYDNYYPEYFNNLNNFHIKSTYNTNKGIFYGPDFSSGYYPHDTIKSEYVLYFYSNYNKGDSNTLFSIKNNELRKLYGSSRLKVLTWLKNNTNNTKDQKIIFKSK